MINSGNYNKELIDAIVSKKKYFDGGFGEDEWNNHWIKDESGSYKPRDNNSLKLYYIFLLEIEFYKKFLSGTATEEEINSIKKFISDNCTVDEELESFNIINYIDQDYVSNVHNKAKKNNIEGKIPNISFLSKDRGYNEYIETEMLSLFATDRIIKDDKLMKRALKSDYDLFGGLHHNRNIELKPEYIEACFNNYSQIAQTSEVLDSIIDATSYMNLDDRLKVEKEVYKNIQEEVEAQMDESYSYSFEEYNLFCCDIPSVPELILLFEHSEKMFSYFIENSSSANRRTIYSIIKESYYDRKNDILNIINEKEAEDDDSLSYLSDIERVDFKIYQVKKELSALLEEKKRLVEEGKDKEEKYKVVL